MQAAAKTTEAVEIKNHFSGEVIGPAVREALNPDYHFCDACRATVLGSLKTHIAKVHS